MQTPLPQFPLDGPGLRQFMQHMWEVLHDTAPEQRSAVWEAWIQRAYDIESESLMPTVDAGIRELAREYRNGHIGLGQRVRSK